MRGGAEAKGSQVRTVLRFKRACNRWPYLIVAAIGTMGMIGVSGSILYQVAPTDHAGTR